MSSHANDEDIDISFMFQCDIDASSMSDIKLLQQEKEMYEMWVRYTAKSTTGVAFGAFAALATLGMSLLVSGPIVGRKIYWANYYSRQSALCTAEVQRRRLQSLSTSYARLATYCLTTLTISGFCSTMPFMDGVGELASGVADYMIEPAEGAINYAADMATERVNFLFDAFNESTEIITAVSDIDIKEVLDDLPCDVSIDAAHQELLKTIANAAECAKDNAPEILEATIAASGSYAVVIGCESGIGSLLTRQSKNDLARFLKEQNGKLDDKSAHQLARRIFDEPVRLITKFRDLSDGELLQKKQDLVDLAATRSGALGFNPKKKIEFAYAVSSGGIWSQARSSYLLACALKQCEAEISGRGLPSRHAQDTIDAARACMISIAVQLAGRFVVRHTTGADFA